MIELLAVSGETNTLVKKLVPEVNKLKHQSKLLKNVKRGGWASLLVSLGALLQDHGPAIISYILGK